MYPPEVAEEIIRRIALGHSLREICRTDGMPAHPTVIAWARGNHPPVADFPDRYARARDIGLEIMADELIEIADDGTNDWVERRKQDGTTETSFDQEHVQRSRVRVDTRKWLLSKRLPKVYGDRMVHAGDPDAPLIPPDTRPPPEAFLAEWLGKRDKP